MIETALTSNLTTQPQKSSIFFKLHNLFHEKFKIKIYPIPLNPYSKVPSIRNWTDFDPTVFSWARHPGNIGILVGKSNLLVFDCDTTETVSFFEELAKKINLPLNTLIVKTRKGRHYYYLCNFSNELERKQFHKDQIKLDVIAGNKYQVVAPFSLLKLDKNNQILDAKAEDYILFEYNPLNIPDQLSQISQEQYQSIILELEKHFKTKSPISKEPKHKQTSHETSHVKQERELTEDELEKILEIIKPYYQEGQRQLFLLYLAGFLRKDLKISKESVERLYERLKTEMNDDNEDHKARLKAIEGTYQKENIAGYHELCKRLGKEKTDQLVKEIQEALNPKQHMNRPILIPFSKKNRILIDYERKNINLVEFDEEGKLKNSQRVFTCIFEIYVLKNIFDKESFKYEFKCLSKHPVEREFKPKGTIREIWEQIDSLTSYVEMPSIGEIVLKKIANFFFENGYYQEKLEEPPQGFYYTEKNKIKLIIASKFDDKYTHEELVKAAKLLNEYVSTHPQPHIVASVIKAGLLLPFSFVQKQRATKNLIRGLYLHGTTRTGKTQTAKVLQAIWGHEYITNWASFCTEARAAKHLSNSTFPVVVDEVGESLENISLMLKMVFEETIARQILTKGHRTLTFPALANVIMTSNTYFPSDPALLNRFFVFHFPKEAQIPPKDRAKYPKKELFDTLPSIGKFIWNYIRQHGWKDNYIEYATEILKTLFLETLNIVPDWIELPFQAHNEETEEEQEIEREAIFFSALLSFLHSRIKPEPGKYQFARQIYKAIINMELGCIYSTDGWNVYITRELLEACKKFSRNFYFKTLSEIAELTGWQRDIKKIKGKTYRVLSTTIVDFLYKLNIIPKPIERWEFEQFIHSKTDIFQISHKDEIVLSSIEDIEKNLPF
jgi:hypothetical protein